MNCNKRLGDSSYAIGVDLNIVDKQRRGWRRELGVSSHLKDPWMGRRICGEYRTPFPQEMKYTEEYPTMPVISFWKNFIIVITEFQMMVGTRCLVAGNRVCGSSRATDSSSVNVRLRQDQYRTKRVLNSLYKDVYGPVRLGLNLRVPRAVPDRQGTEESKAVTVSTSTLLLLLASMADSSAAAHAESMTSSPPASSYYVSLGLFLFTLPGLWSLIKRSPKAKIKRKTFEVAGPAVSGHMPLDTRARQIFNYFKNYNYTVKETGEVIVFEGNYRASVGQAAALVLYTAISLASTALVLSIAAPFGGNWWYLMTLISPAAGAYYFKNANRTEEFQVKMTTSDDDTTTDITVQGDEEEIDRFRKELDLYEKGMEYVKGILE